MKSDDRPCRDCQQRVGDYTWCECCGSYVCIECGGTHNCVNDMVEDQGELEDDAD